MLKKSYFGMVVIRFFEVEPGAYFRFNRDWWKRTGINDASTAYGRYRRMETETLVGVMKRELTSNVTIIPLPLKEKDPDPF